MKSINANEGPLHLYGFNRNCNFNYKFCCCRPNLTTVMSIRGMCIIASLWLHKSAMATRITGHVAAFQQLVQENSKWNIKSLHYWPFVKGPVCDRWIPLRKGQLCGKSRHDVVMWLCSATTDYIPNICTYPRLSMVGYRYITCARFH